LNEGKVDLEDVIKVLRENGISVEKDATGNYSRNTYILKRQGHMIEAIELPKQFRRRLLHTFARKYQFDVSLFYFRERGEISEGQ
jgi:hypothetical protein